MDESQRVRTTTTANTYNIVLLGTGAVGKSAITLRIVKDTFDPSYDPTIEDSYTKAIIVDAETSILEILDTAGQEQFVALQETWIKQGLAFLVVYSVDSQLSFRAAEEIYNKIKLVKDDQEHHIVLFANKCDLGDGRREVQKQQGQSLADSWNVKFFEGSALSSLNVLPAFEELVRSCRAKRNDKKAPESEDTTCCVVL